ncbi:MAG: hypothetical protein OXS47_02560 [Chloroflexota bacterium]|nr:hypothetical protein [Chloroflexota bacterium]
MTTTTKQGTSKNTKRKTPSPEFVSRYLGIESHLSERNGSTSQVRGIANERPAGRKLADDIARTCNELAGTGYEVFSIVPLVSGRVAEAAVEAEQPIYSRTYTEDGRHYLDTGIGYGVTDGVIVMARLRN